VVVVVVEEEVVEEEVEEEGEKEEGEGEGEGEEQWRVLFLRKTAVGDDAEGMGILFRCVLCEVLQIDQCKRCLPGAPARSTKLS